MTKESFSLKVRAVRDTIIDCIQELSSDKENLLPNIKTIKELTAILKEMDRIDDREDRAAGEGSKDEFYDFYNKIKEKVVLPFSKKEQKREEKIDYE